jgi:hypothetical protein
MYVVIPMLHATELTYQAPKEGIEKVWGENNPESHLCLTFAPSHRSEHWAQVEDQPQQEQNDIIRQLVFPDPHSPSEAQMPPGPSRNTQGTA